MRSLLLEPEEITGFLSVRLSSLLSVCLSSLLSVCLSISYIIPRLFFRYFILEKYCLYYYCIYISKLKLSHKGYVAQTLSAKFVQYFQDTYRVL